MRAIIQRVKQASVAINGETKATINQGLLVFLGIEEADSTTDITWLSNKITKMRLFNDADGVMNKSVIDINANIIVVSQFTLFASTKKGNRPSYTKAAKPDISVPLYDQFIQQIQTDLGKPVGTGQFGADMQVSLINDGPVTIQIDSQNKE